MAFRYTKKIFILNERERKKSNKQKYIFLVFVKIIVIKIQNVYQISVRSVVRKAMQSQLLILQLLIKGHFGPN